MAEKQEMPRPSGRGCRTQLLHRVFVGLCEQGHQTSDAWSNTLVMSRSRYLQQSGACAKRYDIFKVTWGGSAQYLYRYVNIYNNKANYPWANGSGERRVSLRLTWSHVDLLGLTRLHLDYFGFTWLHLDSLQLIGIHLDSTDLAGIHLDAVGRTW